MKRVMLAAAAAALGLAACEDASVNRVVDGERVVVQGHKIRLHQVDAPEIADAKCDAERTAGELTVERLQGEFLSARELSFRKTGMACLQFMWCGGFVTADGRDLSEMLIEEGLAVRSSAADAKMHAHDWCAEPLRPESAAGDAASPAGPTENTESGLMSADDAPQDGDEPE